MASGAQLVGGEKLRRDILAMDPSDRRKVLDPALIESALLVARNAATQQIKRGGKGAPIKGKLTSRTGTLRRSLGPNFAVDRSGLSRAFIEVGTNLKYGAVHETGGTFSVGGHVRTSKKGQRFGVRPHTVTFPPRPFLEPALDDTFQKFPAIFVKHWARAAKL